MTLIVICVAVSPFLAKGQMLTYTNAILVSHSSNDGDSFYVAMNGGTNAIRLYYVDAPETSASGILLRRVREQMRYFGHNNPAETIHYGHRATAFVRETLSQPFTVHTVHATALGGGESGRIYAFITAPCGEDLAVLLVNEGLARVRGVARETPCGISRDEYSAYLRDRELAAAMRRAGAWKDTDPERLVALRAEERAEERELQDIQIAIAENMPRININTASPEELMQIRGVGEVRAQAIINARPFKEQSDVFRVPGLPRSVANEVLNHIEM